MSTVNEDAAIRRRVREKLSAREARKALTLRFPCGSAKDDAERRRRELQRRSPLTAEREAWVLDQLAEEVITAYRRNQEDLARSFF